MLDIYEFYINLTRIHGRIVGDAIFDKWFRFWTASGSSESCCSAYRAILNL